MNTSVERIGPRIVVWRKSRGLSRHQLAVRSGLDRGGLADIERGRKDPRTRSLKKISAALGAGAFFLSDLKIVGRRIRLVRNLRLLSQTEFARLCGARKDQLSEWERGEVVPSLPALRRICAAFGIGLDYLCLTRNGDEAVLARRAAVMERVGDRVRQLCAARGLSHRAVDRRACFCRGTVSRIVNGRRKPCGRTLLRICAALDLPPAVFFAPESIVKPWPTFAPIHSPAAEVRP